MGQDWEKNWEYIRLIHKASLVFGPPFTHYLLFKCYLQSKEIFIKCEMMVQNRGMGGIVRSAETQHLMHKVQD